MKKTWILAALVLVAGAGIFLAAANKEKDTDSNNLGSSEGFPTPVPQSNSQSKSGAYIDYSPDAVAKTAGTKLLFFHAPWCPQCRAIETDIKEKGVPEGVSIIKIDYDSSQELRKKYGVTIQTTLVKVDDQGNLVKKYVAYDEPNLEAVKENLL